MNKRFSLRWRLVFLITPFLLTLTSCLDSIRYRMPCEIPNTVAPDEIIGTWQAAYNHYLNADAPSELISGVETIIFREDNTYTQTFSSANFTYDATQVWEMISDEPDGLKVAMYGLKYFANGLSHADGPLLLGLQMFDELHYQDIANPQEKKAKTFVSYPEDGFVFLYPRTCLWELDLLQMVSGSGDPDALAVQNPVFKKLR